MTMMIYIKIKLVVIPYIPYQVLLPYLRLRRLPDSNSTGSSGHQDLTNIIQYINQLFYVLDFTNILQLVLNSESGSIL